MDRDRLLELLDAYLEQRLDESDRRALNAELRASPEARRLFWDYTYQHALLYDLIGEARGQALAEEETTLIQPATATSPSDWRRSALVPLLSSLALLLLLGFGLSGLLQILPRSNSSSLEVPEEAFARLNDLRGEVLIIDDTSRRPARSGQLLRPGEEIRTGQRSFAVVTYPDSSRLEITAETSVRLLDDRREANKRSGKRVFLIEGALNALVAPQPFGLPMQLSTLQADLLATGNRFSSASVLGETRIEMEEGKALLSRKGDARSIEIENGTFAVASPELEVFRPAPLLPAGGPPAAILEDTAGPILSLAPINSGRTLAVGCSSGQIKLWDYQRRQIQNVLPAQEKRLLSMSASSDGRFLAAGYEPLHKTQTPFESLLIWDVRKGKLDRSLPAPRRVHTLAYTLDGRSLLIGSHGRPGLSVWDLPRHHSRSSDVGTERCRLGDRHDRARAIALAPDDRSVAVGHTDGQIRLWDLHNARPLRTLRGHTRDVQALAFQPDGRLLASGSRDGTVRLWSAETGEQIRQFEGKFGEVRCLAFSPDGQTLVSGHAGIAILWNLSTGQQRTTLKAHKFAITALVYLDQGRILATAGWDRTVKLWNLQPVQTGAL